MKTLITVSSVCLALAGVAQGEPRLPQNRQPQTEERYQPRNELADVRLDARSGRAYVRLPRANAPLDYLELRAGRARFALDDVEVVFADGTSMRTGDRGVVQPFEGRVIDLPRRSAPVTAVVAHYRTMGHRVPARLQVFGVREHGGNRWSRRAHR